MTKQFKTEDYFEFDSSCIEAKPGSFTFTPAAPPTNYSGPITLTLYAAIDQEDTNWIIVLKDVGPDVSVRTAREGERDVPSTLPERELTRGWLKASYRALDEKRSKPWEQFHKLTQDSIAPMKPGEVVEYRIQILATANQFKAGHRICLDITSMDVPTGTGAMTNVEYIPYHVCSSKTVTHKIYRDAERPSHLLLPIIPQPADPPRCLGAEGPGRQQDQRVRVRRCNVGTTREAARRGSAKAWRRGAPRSWPGSAAFFSATSPSASTSRAGSTSAGASGGIRR